MVTIQSVQGRVAAAQSTAVSELARQNETLVLRLMASDRARLSAATTSFDCVVNRLLTASDVTQCCNT